MSETTKVQPALTEHQWTHKMVGASHGSGWPATTYVEVTADGGLELDDECHYIHPRLLHGVAALALHGQPFGFTHEGLAAIRECIIGAERNFTFHGEVITNARAEADRIAALLPPREGS